MADRQIRELPQTNTIESGDLFAVSQGGIAKSINGSNLVQAFIKELDGYGGVTGITGPTKETANPLEDTYTIHYVQDDRTDKFIVTNGEKGDPASVYFRYSNVIPSSNADITVLPSDSTSYIGIASNSDGVAPLNYYEYTWSPIRGEKGDPAEPDLLNITYGASTSSSRYPEDYYDSITSVPASDGDFIWTRVEYIREGVVYNTAYTVSHVESGGGGGGGDVSTITFGDTTYTPRAGDVSIPFPTANNVGAIPNVNGLAGQVLTWDGTSNRWVAATAASSVQTVNGIGITPGTKNIQLTAQSLVDIIYPVGSIYMSLNITSPASIFGGSWSQIKDVFLLAAGDSHTVTENAKDGGAETVTLGTNQIPSHNHGSGASGYSFMRADTIATASVTVGSSTAKYVYTNANHHISTTSVTANAGGGQSHENMPPYKTVYMWQRIE